MRIDWLLLYVVECCSLSDQIVTEPKTMLHGVFSFSLKRKSITIAVQNLRASLFFDDTFIFHNFFCFK